jgi:hypothetical protein
MKEVLKHLWRVIPAAVLLILISSASFWFLNTFQSRPAADVPWRSMGGWLLASRFLMAAVLTYATLRSRWSGTQLVCAVFVAFFGVHTFMNISQAFMITPEVMTPQMAALLTAHGFLVALAFSFVLVAVTGRMWLAIVVAESKRLHLPAREWLWKFGLSAGVWVGLYVLAQVFSGRYARGFHPAEGLVPWWELVMLQTGRALLVVAFVLPVVKMLEGGRLEAGLTVAFLLCILGGIAPMALPMADLPEQTRLALNFVYGFLVGYLFSREPLEL